MSSGAEKEAYIKCEQIGGESPRHLNTLSNLYIVAVHLPHQAVQELEKGSGERLHILKVIPCEAELLAAKARREGSSIIQQLQIIGEQEKIKNRNVIKALLLCTHFLTRKHIPHTTNFDKLVDLVVSCGGEDPKQVADRAGRNATYTSTIDVFEAIGTWVDEFQLKLLHKAPSLA